jgi:RimJ/RimL family protein N-acetyltransferase
MRVFLETERLTLRRFTEADEDNLFELNSDPEVMRFLAGGKPTPRDEVTTRIIPAFLGYYERFEGFGYWAAVESVTGQFLGWFLFRPPLRAAGTPAG